MSRFALRIGFAAALISFGWLSTIWVRSGYTFEVQPLGRNLNDLPAQIGDYVGTDVPVEEGVRRILNADALLNRTYSRPDKDWISVHVSAWIRPESISSVAPHNPKLCYINGGWKIIEERRIKVETASRQLPLEVLLLERNQERCVVAFWYRMGSAVFNDATQARRVHRELWGKPNWPPTIKVMLQFPGEDIDTVLPHVKRTAATVFDFTSQL